MGSHCGIRAKRLKSLPLHASFYFFLSVESANCCFTGGRWGIGGRNARTCGWPTTHLTSRLGQRILCYESCEKRPMDRSTTCPGPCASSKTAFEYRPDTVPTLAREVFCCDPQMAGFTTKKHIGGPPDKISAFQLLSRGHLLQPHPIFGQTDGSHPISSRGSSASRDKRS